MCDATLAWLLYRITRRRCSAWQNAGVHLHLVDPSFGQLDFVCCSDLNPRRQVVQDPVQPGLTFCLDGAHTPESMATCAQWFAEQLQQQQQEHHQGHHQQQQHAQQQQQRAGTALLFSCMKDRDPAVLLPALAHALREAGVGVGAGAGPGGPGDGGASDPHLGRVGLVVLTPMLSGGGVLLGSAAGAAGSGGAAAAALGAGGQHEGAQQQQPVGGGGGAAVDLSWQERMREVWEGECGGAGAAEEGAGPRVVVAGSLQDALAVLRRQAGSGAVAQAAGAQPQQRQGLRVLVTGSLYLVGDTLRLLGRPPE